MRVGRARCLVWALLGLTALTAGQARAAEQLPLTLDYLTEPSLRGCPDAVEFRHLVTQQLGYDPFQDNQPRRVVVRAAAQGNGLTGKVEWRDAGGAWRGEQTFSSRDEDCEHLTNAMGFAVVVQVQLLGTSLPPAARISPPPAKAPVVRPPPATKAPAPRSAPPPAQPPPPPTPSTPPPLPPPPTPPGDLAVPPVAPSPPPAPSPGSAFWLGLGPFLGVGLAPNLTVEGRIFAALQFSRTSLQLGAEAAWPVTFRQTDNTGFTQQIFVLTAAGCVDGERWSGCALGKVGTIRVRGVGLDESHSSSGTFSQVGLRLAMTQKIREHLYVVAHLDALTTLTQWTVSLNRAAVWTTSSLAATAGIDLAVRFR